MTLNEAHDVAIELEADPRFAVVAIGRFELIANLVKAHAGAYPWGVSICSRIDPNYKGICRTRDELAEFVLLAPQPAKRKPAPAKPAAAPIAAPAKTKPAAAPEAQSLFAFE